MIHFADTSYYLALLNPQDSAHQLAAQYARESHASLLTTDWIITELGDALSRPPSRKYFEVMLRAIREDPQTQIVPADAQLQRDAIDLYLARPDKSWSLTDCASFVVMERFKITDALTADCHSEQAGFRALLKPD